MSDALLRRALFLLDSEPSHDAALRLLATAQAVPGGLAILRARYARGLPTAPVTVAGLRFPNRVGLAAGYDKNAVAWRAFAALGFGHVEVGTVTPRPQPGNPRPRVFRLPEHQAVINRLGFPSEGADAVHARLTWHRPHGVILGVNLGRNKDTPNERAAEDYAALVDRFADVADYLTVNVSSPNTPALRALQAGEPLRALLSAVVKARDVQAAGRVLPVFVKLAPDLGDADLDDAIGAVHDAGIDGVIATNTTLSRDGVEGHPHAAEAGGLSGAPLTARAAAMVGRIRRRLGDTLPLVSVGGIGSAAQARARIDAGADLVQVYTGIIYAGPALGADIARALAGVSRGGQGSAGGSGTSSPGGA